MLTLYVIFFKQFLLNGAQKDLISIELSDQISKKLSFSLVVHIYSILSKITFTWSVKIVPKVKAPTIVPDVLAMVIIVEGRIRNEKEYPGWTPREVIATVPLCTDHHFPRLPEKESEAMNSISQKHKWNWWGNLS